MLTGGGGGGGQGSRAWSPNGSSSMEQAGCQPGDASASACLGPEVSRRAGRTPGNRSRAERPARAGSRKPGDARAPRSPRSRTHFPIVPVGLLRFSEAVQGNGSPGPGVGSSGFSAFPLRLTCGVTRNPAGSELTYGRLSGSWL